MKVTYINSNCLQITYDERLSLPDNKDLKKQLKEKVLHNNKGKLVIDYKSTYFTQSNSYILIPTDMILVLKENQELGKVKTAMISYFKEKDFTVELKPISGGESITFETVISGQDGRFCPLKIPVKMYFKGKKLMIQGFQKSQEIFLEFYSSSELFPQGSFHESTFPRPAISNLRSLISSVNQNQVTAEPLHTWSENLDRIQMIPRHVNQFSRFMSRNSLSTSPSRQLQLCNLRNTVSNLEAEFVSFKEELKSSITLLDEFQNFKETLNILRTNIRMKFIFERTDISFSSLKTL